MGMSEQPADAAIVYATIELAHNLGRLRPHSGLCAEWASTQLRHR
jgi:hypothetical protein